MRCPKFQYNKLDMEIQMHDVSLVNIIYLVIVWL